MILALVLCVSLLPTTARAADCDFAIENGVLTEYNGMDGDVTTPCNITSIGNYAFVYCDSLTSVTIGNSVTSIGEVAFYHCGSLTDVYYTGSEAQWKRIKIYSGNDDLTNATIHYNSKLVNGNVIPVTATDANIPGGRYCIYVIDENNESLKDATVTWNDWVDLLIDITDAECNAFFDNLTIGTPLISVELIGCTTWTNANSNWRKSPDLYETIVFYPESSGDYKFASAQYSAKSDFSSAVNLLVSTKKVNLKNDGNLVGDLTNGEFYIACSATKPDGVIRYELWQNQAGEDVCAAYNGAGQLLRAASETVDALL